MRLCHNFTSILSKVLTEFCHSQQVARRNPGGFSVIKANSILMVDNNSDPNRGQSGSANYV